jgi:hypothetical protein
MSEHDVSLPELSRDVAELRAGMGRLEAQVAALPDREYLTLIADGWRAALAASSRETSLRVELVDQAAQGRAQTLGHRLDGVEAWQTWAMRLVLGAVLLAGLGLVLVRPS